MNILVCIKRVPATAGQITLTPDGQEIDTRYLGFTVSPTRNAPSRRPCA